jgi:hypothetical protein
MTRNEGGHGHGRPLAVFPKLLPSLSSLFLSQVDA